MRSPRDSRAESASRHRRRLPKAMLVISLCILAAALLLGVAAPAQAADGDITGTVWEGFGVPLAGVTVTAYHFDGGSWTAVGGAGTDTTDANGEYTLTVPVATGYHVGFAMAGYVDQWWANKATQLLATAIDDVHDTVDVTGINATLVTTSTFVTTVDAVTGTEPMDGTLTIAWHSSATLPITDPGTFWYWVRSAGATDWYMQGSLDVDTLLLPGRDFEADIEHLAVPDAAGYQIVVGYDPSPATPGTFVAADITSWGTSTGSFAVRAGLTVNTPVPATYGATGDPMQVVWQTTAPISSGSFGIWVRSSSLANWYEVEVFPWNQALSKKVAHGAGFTNWTYTLASLGAATPAVPVGTGYQIIVAWEPNAWPAGTPVTTWVPTASTVTTPSGPMCWATSPGAISVTAADTIEITSVTSPSTGEYAWGDDMTITWTTNITNIAADGFGVWARSTNLTSWYRLYAAPPFSEAVLGRTTFTHDITLAGAYAALNWIPAGTYQIVVACHSGAGAPPWDSYGTSVGTFTVVE